MTLDFTDSPVIDNHCHLLDPKKAVLDQEWLTRELYHGMNDLPKADVKPKLWGASPELCYHLQCTGIFQTMLCRLSKVLRCDTKIDAVVAERNRRTSKDFSLRAATIPRRKDSCNSLG
jgi:hypothetical protein